MTEETSHSLEARNLRIRLIKRVGNAFFGILVLWLSVPMLIGAFGGLSRGEIRDPYTGRPLSETASIEKECLDAAKRLMVQAGRLEKIERRWDEKYRAWNTKCRSQYPTLHDVLMETRVELRRGRAAGLRD